ncbi:2-oxoglutarate and iron-dependent oxygenase domain-containing protein 3 isoform X2 [Symphalangus syndactylus]|uniref:2-oxoglutarate and iron-dependent oxygenase domain-containing protein 3 isoform X2 n=1 Tax=Symphalangus syndactylus TaxID=9590 RepID=UPI003005CD44
MQPKLAQAWEPSGLCQRHPPASASPIPRALPSPCAASPVPRVLPSPPTASPVPRALPSPPPPPLPHLSPGHCPHPLLPHPSPGYCPQPPLPHPSPGYCPHRPPPASSPVPRILSSPRHPLPHLSPGYCPHTPPPPCCLTHPQGTALSPHCLTHPQGTALSPHCLTHPQGTALTYGVASWHSCSSCLAAQSDQGLCDSQDFSFISFQISSLFILRLLLFVLAFLRSRLLLHLGVREPAPRGEGPLGHPLRHHHRLQLQPRPWHRGPSVPVAGSQAKVTSGGPVWRQPRQLCTRPHVHPLPLHRVP